MCKRVIIINKGEIIADDTPDNLSNKLSNDHSLVARIICNEDDMLSALRTIKGVKSVVSLGSKEKGSVDFCINPEDGMDVRAAVFERVSERSRTLLSFTDNSLSLEQVFLRLTEAEDNTAARRMLGLDDFAEDASLQDTLTEEENADASLEEDKEEE